MRNLALIGTLALAASCAPEGDLFGRTDTELNGEPTPPVEGFEGSGWVVSTVTVAESGRATYVQVVPELTGDLDIRYALEFFGNPQVSVTDDAVFVGLAEEPTWRRYRVDDNGRFVADGKLSFAARGWDRIDFGNVFVRDDLAVSVNTEMLEAVVWDPTTLTIRAAIDLSGLKVEGYDLEVSPVTAHEGRVYVPGRHVNWNRNKVNHQTMLAVLDPDAGELVRILTDDRCPASGAPWFDADGRLYTMSDGRNYAAQMFARAAGDRNLPRNCFLRTNPDATAFDASWSVDVTELTGGRESITTNWFTDPTSGSVFAKVLYEDRMPEGEEPIDFNFWAYDIGLIWRFDVDGTTLDAEPVEGLPYSGISFDAFSVDNALWVGEIIDPWGEQLSEVYRVDPVANRAEPVFTVPGYFFGAYPWGGATYR